MSWDRRKIEHKRRYDSEFCKRGLRFVPTKDFFEWDDNNLYKEPGTEFSFWEGSSEFAQLVYRTKNGKIKANHNYTYYDVLYNIDKGYWKIMNRELIIEKYHS